MSDMNTVRPRLDWFVDQMRGKLARSRNQAKEDWRSQTPVQLLQRIRQEVAELEAAMLEADAACRSHEAARAVVQECADVANMSMMLADLYLWQWVMGSAPAEPSTEGRDGPRNN